MHTEKNELNSLSDRLELVEDQNRRLKQLIWVTGILATAILLMGGKAALEDGAFRNITAHTITLVDQYGNKRVLIGSTQQGYGLNVLNSNGQNVISMGLTKDESGSGLLVTDKAGIPRIGFGMENGVPSLAITNDSGKKIIGVGGDKSGYGVVVMDQNEVERVGIGFDEGASAVAIYDDQGQYARGIVRENNGTHYFSYVNARGEEIIRE